MIAWRVFSKFIQGRRSANYSSFYLNIHINSHLQNITPICSSGFLLNPYVYSGHDTHQVRCYAARKGKQIARKQSQRGRKKEKEGKKPFVFPFLRSSPEKVFIKPRRYNVDGWLSDQPADNIFRTKYYKKLTYPVKAAVEMHRETHHPTMYNVPDATLSATVELDMRLKKKTRYLSKFSGILYYPHHFDTGVSRTVIVICKDSSEKEKALEAGAHLAGGSDIIRQFNSGDLTSEDFDYLVVHPEMITELIAVRGLLKKKFPTIATGNLTMNVVDAVHRFRKGIKYNANTDDHELDFGWLDVPIGKLNMPIEEIESNLDMLLKTVDNHKPKDTNPGTFITRVLLLSPPSREKLLIPHSDYLLHYKQVSKEETTDEKELEEDEEKEAVA